MDKVKFETALATVLAHEVAHLKTETAHDDGVDPGGLTKFGVSLRFAIAHHDDINGDGTVNAQDIRDLTFEEAEEVYDEDFWRPFPYAEIDAPLQPVANKLLQLTVNAGSHQSHVCLQRALNSLGFVLEEDGAFGEHTLTAVNETPCEKLLPALQAQQWSFYEHLMATRPKLEIYRNGWRNRVFGE